MSTKNIEAVLLWASRGDAPAELAEAVNEVGAIRRAAKTLARLGLDLSPSTSLEDVQAHSDAERLLAAIAKETP